MKKIRVLVLGVALLSGCATNNPHSRVLEDLTGTTIGAGGAYAIAMATKANPATVIGATILGGIMGHEAVKAAQWEDTGASPTSVVVVPSVPYSYSGAYDAYGRRVYGPYGSGYGGYYYRDQWRTDGYCHNAYGARVPCPGAYPISPPVVVVTKKRSASIGPTVDDYIYSPMIHPDCKTGNWGADGKCLIRLAPALKEEQKICEADPKDVKCPKGYNPGKWAQIYRRLGGELIARQRE